MLKLDWVTWATIGILLGLLIVAWAFVKPMAGESALVIKEAPLQKNAQFGLKPGEIYRYEYSINGTPVNTTYAMFQGEGCVRVEVLESQNSTGTCIGPDGTDGGGSNATLSNPAIMLFKPWMLALRGGWRWNTSMFLVIGGTEEHVADTYYRVLRREEYGGRDSFVVEIAPGSEEGLPEYAWVDAERRIALRIMGEGYEIVLAEG